MDWRKKEKRDANYFGGKRTPRSGGIWSFPGDVVNEKLLIDCKVTDKKGFRITVEMWDKIYGEALNCGKIPCLSIRFGNGTELVVLDKNDVIK